MFGSSILEVAIGLVFVYLLLSLMCTALSEIIEAKLKNRATDLERGIRELFGVVIDSTDTNDEIRKGDLIMKFYNHALISGLFSGPFKERDKEIGRWDYLKKTNLPSYIPAANFAQAVLDIVSPNDTEVSKNEKLRSALETLKKRSGEDDNKLRENIEAWFNSSMDRVSGWYTRRTKLIILIMGIILTVWLNVNTITITKRLANDNALRNALVAEAERRGSSSSSLPTANFEENRKQLESLGLPVGREHFDWYSAESGKFNWWNNVFLHLFGWLLTAAAISLGAPFWFDVLNKIMVIRSTVKPHEKSLEESSEDRQTSLKPVSVLTFTSGTSNLSTGKE